MTRKLSNLPRTLGSIRSWQYDSAVSEMACSSSVSKLLAFKGSFQSNDTGVVMCRLPIGAERMFAFKGLDACLQSGRSIVIEDVDHCPEICVVEVMVQMLRSDISPSIEIGPRIKQGTAARRSNRRSGGNDPLNPRF